MNVITRRIFALCFGLLWFCGLVRGYEEWIPMVANFNSNDYGAARTTWRISTCGEWAFFANQRGLLEYDGTSWRHYSLNNHSEVRSVMVMSDRKRVWVGGEYEFGYFDVRPQGVLQYHCLSDSLPASVRADLGNVFDFYEMGGITYARCDYYIIIIAGEKMTVVHSKDKIFASTMWNGTVYLATDHEILMLTGHQLLPIESSVLPKTIRINTMIPFNRGILIASANYGLYYYDGMKIDVYPTCIDVLLRDGCVCCMASHGSRLAFGTLAFGLLILDEKTGAVEKYDNSCGLQSNTVQSLAFDERGNIWCGLNTGIDRVMLANPFTSLYRIPRSYGMGYTALLDDGKLYLGTNQGLFYAPYPIVYHDRQTILLGTGIPMGTAWFLYKHGEDLLLMHDRGAFIVEEDKNKIIPNTSGVWSCIPVQGHPDMLFAGAYAGVYVLKRDADGEWRSLGRISGLTEPGRFLAQTDEHSLNVYNARQDSVHTYRLSDDLLRVVSVEAWHEKYVPKNEIGKELALPGFGPARQSYALSDTLKIIPNEEGFMLVDMSRMKNENRSVMIEALYATEPTDSLLYLANFSGTKFEPIISYKYNSLRLEFKAAPLYPARLLTYQYRLWEQHDGQPDKDEGWSEPTSSEFRTFSDLHEGGYTFDVRTLLAGEVQSADSISFRILPPWYRTWAAYTIFFCLAALVVWLVVMFENHRFARKNAATLAEKNEEVSQMKVEIDKLEKDKMELDLRHKSQEIANLVLNVSRKNEILSELKTDVLRVANRMGIDTASQNKRNLMLIGNKIDTNIEADDMLKRFEEQFDLVNNNFMQKLQQRHPDITPNERLACAYLKMGLASKEMASLLNISVRGVESIRFRLRKKFGLENGISLTEYLNNIQ